MATTRIISSNHLQAIELPDLLQSLINSGKDGRLEVQSGSHYWRFSIRQGRVEGMSGEIPYGLRDAMRWSGLDHIEVRLADGSRPATLEDHRLAVAMLQGKHLDQQRLAEILDYLVEENFCEMFVRLDNSSEWGFTAAAPPDPWQAFQATFGLAAPVTRMLMEALRRLDESRRVAGHLPSRWDLLIPQAVPAEADLDDNTRLLLRSWQTNRPFGAIETLSGLTPWQARISAANLIRSAVWRRADANEILVVADESRRLGRQRTAEGLYRRSLELGGSNPRVHLILAELAEERGNTVAAARDYLQAANLAEATNPLDAVMALRSAVRLGAPREEVLPRLLEIYCRTGEHDDAISVLFELAQHYENANKLPEAMQAVRQAQELGADALRCEQVLAALALLLDDISAALLHFEAVMHLALDRNSPQDLEQAQMQVIRLDPGRVEVVVDHARRLVAQGRPRTEAVRIIRACLAAPSRPPGERLEIQLRELISEFDPEDRANQEWLASAYARSKNRADAAGKLERLAEAQEREGNLSAYASTLERILALGGDQIEVLVRLADALARIGQDRASLTRWIQACDQALADDDLPVGQSVLREALAAFPWSGELHRRMADVAMRQGDHPLAEAHLRRASDLFRGTGDTTTAAELLRILIHLHPQNIQLHLELIECDSDPGPNSDLALAECMRACLETRNFGLALDASRLRVKRAQPPALTQRLEMVELLRRCGLAQEEIREGRSLGQDLVQSGETERAIALWERLVAAHDRRADLLIELADLQDSLGRHREAARHLRQAIVVLQQEQKPAQARKLLERLLHQEPDNLELTIAAQVLGEGRAINWVAIREEVVRLNQQRLAEESGRQLAVRPKRAATRAVWAVNDQPAE